MKEQVNKQGTGHGSCPPSSDPWMAHLFLDARTWPLQQGDYSTRTSSGGGAARHSLLGVDWARPGWRPAVRGWSSRSGPFRLEELLSGCGAGGAPTTLAPALLPDGVYRDVERASRKPSGSPGFSKWIAN